MLERINLQAVWQVAEQGRVLAQAVVEQQQLTGSTEEVDSLAELDHLGAALAGQELATCIWTQPALRADQSVG